MQCLVIECDFTCLGYDSDSIFSMKITSGAFEDIAIIIYYIIVSVISITRIDAISKIRVYIGIERKGGYIFFQCLNSLFQFIILWFLPYFMEGETKIWIRM